MELKGLKINFLGDSITEGIGASALKYTYVSQFKALSGAVCRNYGISGTRIAEQKTLTSDCLSFDLDFCYRYKQMNKDADVVAVFGGTNDYDHGDAPLGKFEDRTAKTFYGALHCLYSGLKEMYPNSFVFVMLPLHREGEDKQTTPQYFDGHLIDYVEAIKKVANYYDLPILDLYNESGMLADTKENSKKYFDDGLHPNDFGCKIIAEMVYEFLKNA